MTKYVVLRQIDAVAPLTDEEERKTYDENVIFPALVRVGAFEANDGDGASKATAATLYKNEGVVGRVTLVAVPARSYQPADLTIEQEPSISVVARVGGPPVRATA